VGQQDLQLPVPGERIRELGEALDQLQKQRPRSVRMGEEIGDRLRGIEECSA
jgi:hypothetical protein